MSFEKIYVRYQLQDDSLVWWPALVQDVTIGCGHARDEKACILLVFDAMHGHDAEQAWFEMIDENTLMAKWSSTKDGERECTEWCDEDRYLAFHMRLTSE